MSTEAPAAPTKKPHWTQTLTPEQKAARNKHLSDVAAKKRAAAASPDASVPPSPAPAVAEPSPSNVALLDQIAALKAQLAAATPVLPDVSTLPTRDAYFEFVRPKGTAMEKITTLEDERWAEMTGGKWYGRAIIGGTFVVRRLARAASGEILEDKCVMETCKTVDHPLALTMLKAFLATGDHTRIA